MGLLMGLRESPFRLRPMNSQGIWLKVRYQMGVHGQPAIGGLFSFGANSNIPENGFQAWKADTTSAGVRKAPVEVIKIVCKGPKGRHTMD